MKWDIKHLAVLAILVNIPTNADITTDGSVGSATSLIGPNYQISADLGTQKGNNLFHSFGKFSIGKGEIATFTGPGTVENIVSRVTGGGVSNIDGTIRSTIPKANLYLVNPNGIVFGKNAQIDVQGAFIGSTANYVELKDGSKYYSNPKSNSILSSAPPSAFGFLTDNPANITIKSKKIQMKQNQGFTLIGGNIDISIDENEIGINAGNISLFSVGGKGKVYPLENRITTSSKQGLGAITLHGYAKLRVNTKGITNAGNIFIYAGRLNILDSVKINSDSRSAGKAGDITLKSDSIKITGHSEVTSESYSDGNAGSINILTNKLAMNDAGLIDSSTYNGKGHAGNVIINTKTLTMKNDATITTIAHQGSIGNAGSIKINALDISIEGKGNGAEKSALISSNTTVKSKGRGGDINITANTLSLKNDATIGVTSKGTGDAGNIYIDVGTKFTSQNGYVLSKAFSANGGNITLHSNNLFDLQDSNIQTDAKGNGGNIHLSSKQFVLDGSAINANAVINNGGKITLQIENYIRSKQPESTIIATGGSNDGEITISSPEIDLGRALKQLKVNLLINNIKDPCSIQVASDDSSLAIRQNGGCVNE